MKLPVTVVIPIKNEAVNLPICLSKLSAFEEVLVVDSGSSDNSIEIAKSFSANVLQFQWNGQFPKKRNWCLRNYDFKTEWILFLDADEQVTPEFTEELSLTLNDEGCNGYWVTYQNYFMGHLLRYGDKFRKLPLLRIGCGEFEQIDEEAWSTLDMEVHEHLIIKGAVGQLKSPLIHSDFKGLSAYYDRHNQYSSWESARYLTIGDKERGRWTWRQKIKYQLLESPFFPLMYFIGSYILKLGFLDGHAGFRFNISKMFYFYQINFKVAEKRARASTQYD